MLKARGYTVHMTRDSDVFIPLPAARRHRRATDHADLFISLHADSNPDPGQRAFDLHPLDGRSDREAAPWPGAKTSPT